MDNRVPVTGDAVESKKDKEQRKSIKRDIRKKMSKLELFSLEEKNDLAISTCISKDYCMGKGYVARTGRHLIISKEDLG